MYDSIPVMSTQKIAWLIVACCLLLLPIDGLAQAWEVDRQVDAITDDKTVFAVLNGQVVDVVSPHFEDRSIEGATSTIKIWCSDQNAAFPLDVRINSPVLRPEFDLENPNRPPIDFLGLTSLVDRDVIVRFDSEEPQTERWGSDDFSGQSDSVSLYGWHEGYQPYAFLERLANGAHQKLAVRTRDSDIVWTAIFDISEAAPVAQEVRETCHEE